MQYGVMMLHVSVGVVVTIQLDPEASALSLPCIHL